MRNVSVSDCRRNKCTLPTDHGCKQTRIPWSCVNWSQVFRKLVLMKFMWTSYNLKYCAFYHKKLVNIFFDIANITILNVQPTLLLKTRKNVGITKILRNGTLLYVPHEWWPSIQVIKTWYHGQYISLGAFAYIIVYITIAIFSVWFTHIIEWNGEATNLQ